MSEKELLKENIKYDLIINNILVEYYDWNAM